MSLLPPKPWQAQVLWHAATALGLAAIAAVIAGAVWAAGLALQFLSPILWPLAVAGALAYLLDPLVDQLVKWRVPRARAILCVFAIAGMLVAAVCARVLPRALVETKNLVDNLPRHAASLQSRIEQLITSPPKFLQFLSPAQPAGATNSAPVGREANVAPDRELTPAEPAVGAGTPPLLSAGGGGLPKGSAVDAGAIRSATNWLVGWLPSAGSWLFGQVSKVASWLGMLAGLALVPVYTFYFLLEKQGIQKHWAEYLPVTRSAFRDELIFVLRAVNDYLIVFFRSQVLVAMCDAVLYTIGFGLIGLPYALLIGVAAVGLTMIPFLGAMTICGVALTISIVQYGFGLYPLLVLAVVGVVQVIEGLVIAPKILGDRVGLHPLTIIVAVVAGTTLLGGLLGGILAIPLTAALRVLMFRYVWAKR